MLILHAAQEVVAEEGFEDLLNNVRDRIDEIESLHRTRELTVRDVGMSIILTYVARLFPSSRTSIKGIKFGCRWTNRDRDFLDFSGARSCCLFPLYTSLPPTIVDITQSVVAE